MRIQLLLQLILITAVLGSGSVQGQRLAPQAPGSLALLEGRGAVLGTTRYGNADLGPPGSTERLRLEEAATAGLGGFSIYLGSQQYGH